MAQEVPKQNVIITSNDSLENLKEVRFRNQINLSKTFVIPCIYMKFMYKYENIATNSICDVIKKRDEEQYNKLDYMNMIRIKNLLLHNY